MDQHIVGEHNGLDNGNVIIMWRTQHSTKCSLSLFKKKETLKKTDLQNNYYFNNKKNELNN